MFSEEFYERTKDTNFMFRDFWLQRRFGTRASVCPNAYCQTYFTMHTADVFGRKRNVTYVMEEWISSRIVGQVSMFINYNPQRKLQHVPD